MLFGLNNAPEAFMDLINRVLKQYLGMLVIVFTNDIFIYSWSKNEHVDHLRIVFQILKDRQLISLFRKYEFFLGLLLSLDTLLSVKVSKLILRRLR